MLSIYFNANENIMFFNSLSLQQFRCFSTYHTELHPRFNYISGENGAGKTALLEAVSLACTAHSFRVREVAPLIQSDQLDLTIVAHLTDGQTIGIKKSRETATAIKVNGQACYKTSELATLLPSQVIYQDIFQIIDAGPTIRRQVLDWGMFHVKQFYHEWWCQYKQGLKQRNSLLKKQARESELSHWDKTLSELAKKMDGARKEYIDRLNPVFKELIHTLTDISCEISYYNGWDKDGVEKELWVALKENYAIDKIRQYTQYGPHHADLEIISPSGSAKKYLSRGQQKIVLLALKLAQAKCLDKPCIYIWDDICSELDRAHLSQLGELIQSMPGQYFISGINIETSPLFEVNPGHIIKLEGQRMRI